MRILQILHNHKAGGAEQHLVQLCEGLRDAGHEVEAAVPRGSWIGERFAALADMGCSVVLLGGPDERVVAETIFATLPAHLCKRLRVAAQPSVQFSAALLRQCQFCVGNDTGVLNMAVANGVPTLGLFGATSPRAHDPLLHALEAQGMDKITVKAVLAALNQLATQNSAFSALGAVA